MVIASFFSHSTGIEHIFFLEQVTGTGIKSYCYSFLLPNPPIQTTPNPTPSSPQKQKIHPLTPLHIPPSHPPRIHLHAPQPRPPTPHPRPSTTVPTPHPRPPHNYADSPLRAYRPSRPRTRTARPGLRTMTRPSSRAAKLAATGSARARVAGRRE